MTDLANTCPAVDGQAPATLPATVPELDGSENRTARRQIPWLGVLYSLPLFVGLCAFYLRWHPEGDMYFYYEIVALAQRGVHPFIDYWSEYPPVFPLLLVGGQHILGSLLWSDEE